MVFLIIIQAFSFHLNVAKTQMETLMQFASKHTFFIHLCINDLFIYSLCIPEVLHQGYFD